MAMAVSLTFNMPPSSLLGLEPGTINTLLLDYELALRASEARASGDTAATASHAEMLEKAYGTAPDASAVKSFLEAP
jgi:hypothetical protein